MARHFNGFVSRFSAGGKSFNVKVHFPWEPAGVTAGEWGAEDVRLNGGTVTGLPALAAGGWLEFTLRPITPGHSLPADKLGGVVGRVIELAVSDPQQPGSSHAVSGRITGIAVDPSTPDGRRFKMLVAPVIL